MKNIIVRLFLVRPVGIEPTHLAPEASALSTELRAQTLLPQFKQY